MPKAICLNPTVCGYAYAFNLRMYKYQQVYWSLSIHHACLWFRWINWKIFEWKEGILRFYEIEFFVSFIHWLVVLETKLSQSTPKLEWWFKRCESLKPRRLYTTSWCVRLCMRIFICLCCDTMKHENANRNSKASNLCVVPSTSRSLTRVLERICAPCVHAQHVMFSMI